MSVSVAAIVGILVALVVVGGAVFYLGVRRQRTEQLRSRYGPEYARTVSEVGSARRAEHELIKRQERVEHLDIQPLMADERELFGHQWRSLQAKFVDDPGGAVTRADRLVEEVMKTRGYPVSDFEQRAADLSVHHARVVENYRAARQIAARHRRNTATTEDLRKAMVYYRELFQDLLEDREHATERAVERAVEREPLSADQAARAAEAARAENQRTIRVDKDVRP